MSPQIEESQIRRLVGHRKSREVRGPKSIEVFFDRNDGTIHRMILDGLPRVVTGAQRVWNSCWSLRNHSTAGSTLTRFHHDGKRKIKRRGRTAMMNFQAKGRGMRFGSAVSDVPRLGNSQRADAVLSAIDRNSDGSTV